MAATRRGRAKPLDRGTARARIRRNGRQLDSVSPAHAPRIDGLSARRPQSARLGSGLAGGRGRGRRRGAGSAGRVVEERALVKVGALAACGAFEPVANELAAFDQGGDLRELAVGHFPQPVDRLTVIGRRGQQQLDLVERQARALAADRAPRVIAAWVVSAWPEVGVLRLRAVRQGVFGVGWRLDGRGHAGWD